MTLQELRDIAIVILALFGVLQLLLLVVLTILLYKKLLPVLEATKRTIQNIQGTTNFVSETTVRPLIRALSVVSGIRAVGSRVAGFRKRKEK